MPTLWIVAAMQDLGALARTVRQGGLSWHAERQDGRVIGVLRLPLPEVRWEASPLPLWLRVWGLLVAALPCAGLVYALILTGAMHGFSPGGLVTAALKLCVYALLPGVQGWFVARSNRLGALGMTLALLLVAVVLLGPFSVFALVLEGPFALALWLTGGSRTAR